VEDGGGERAHQSADLLPPPVAVRRAFAEVRAQQSKISERVLQESIAALEQFRPLLLLVGEAREPVTGGGNLRIVGGRLAQRSTAS